MYRKSVLNLKSKVINKSVIWDSLFYRKMQSHSDHLMIRLYNVSMVCFRYLVYDQHGTSSHYSSNSVSTVSVCRNVTTIQINCTLNNTQDCIN